MATEILIPEFGDIELWRDVSRNNQAIGRIGYLIASHHSWLPQILTDAGFSPSNQWVRKNRPELHRDVVDGEVVKFGFAWIRFVKLGGRDEAA